MCYCCQCYWSFVNDSAVEENATGAGSLVITPSNPEASEQLVSDEKLRKERIRDS